MYVLHIKEKLAPGWSEEFEGLTVTYTPTGGTQLSGYIPDQSALHGLLARIRDLNLTLISVNPTMDEASQEKIEKEPSMDKLTNSLKD
jgi:hypothetical protein